MASGRKRRKAAPAKGDVPAPSSKTYHETAEERPWHAAEGTAQPGEKEEGAGDGTREESDGIGEDVEHDAESDGSDGEEEEDDDVDTSEEEEEEDDEDDGEGNELKELVDVDFEFFDPKPVDYHGLKGLLKDYLEGEAWDLGGLVDALMSQTTVGTVVKTADDVSPIGTITCLSLQRYRAKRCVADICDFLRSRAKGKPEGPKLEAVLAPPGGAGGAAHNVGLILSERLINTPIDLTPPLHQALFDEIAWATEDEPTAELRDSFKFSQYLILTRVYVETGKRKAQSSQPPAKKLKGGSQPQAGALVYIKPEDEIFHQLCSWSFTFPVQSESSAARQVGGLRQHRLVMAMDAKHVPAFRKRLKRLAEEGES